VDLLPADNKNKKNLTNDHIYSILEATMNVKLNHLLPKTLQREACVGSDKQHYWVPAGEPEAKIGGSFGLQLRCERCDKTHYLFLSKRVHDTQRRLIEKSLKISRNRLTTR